MKERIWWKNIVINYSAQKALKSIFTVFKKSSGCAADSLYTVNYGKSLTHFSYNTSEMTKKHWVVQQCYLPRGFLTQTRMQNKSRVQNSSLHFNSKLYDVQNKIHYIQSKSTFYMSNGLTVFKDWDASTNNSFKYIIQGISNFETWGNECCLLGFVHPDRMFTSNTNSISLVII